MKKDRSLLFGLLAVSMKKVRPDKLSEVARRTQTNSQADLGNSLVDEGLLSKEDREHLDSLVEMSIAEHEGDASATIQALGREPDKIATMVDSMDDFIAAFEKSAGPPPESEAESGPTDSILGDFSEPESLVGNVPPGSAGGDAPPPDSVAGGEPLLDSLLADDDDPARTRMSQSGNTGDRGSVGDIVHEDAPDSFFESISSKGTEIMSPVQAAAEIDDSEIVPAVAEHAGRYETIREFAKGGMGQITLVHDTHLGRDVALKQLLQRHILPETQPGAPTTAILTIPIIARFLQEARITGQLEHPSIIPVYELGYREDGSLYYTMKLVRGQSMHEFLKDAKTLKDRLPLLTHFLDLCQAITYAHTRGVIHRDLKPMNVMIGEFGETVLIDWGIAKVRGEDDIHAKGLKETITAMRVSSAEATAKTMYGQTIGSPYFMPAEQAMGRTDLIDERSDIYSLGAVLYSILTGKMPYHGSNVREFMEKVGHVDPKPVRMLEPDVRPELEAIVKKAMALVPENRYQSARELTDDVQKYLSGGMVDAYNYSLGEMLRKYYKKHKKVLNTAALFTILLLGSGIFYTINLKIAKDAEAAARVDAEIARDQEEAAKVAEAAAKDEAIAQRNRAQQELYYANIANTRFNIGEQQMDKARSLLAECLPEELRQWEWGHFEAVAHADMMTLDRGGKFTAFADGGNALIVATARGSLSLHDLETGEMIHEFVRTSGNGAAVAASADGSRVALRSDDAVQVWDVASQEEIIHFDEPQSTSSRHFLDMSPDGQYVAALNSDKVTRIWDVNAGEVALTIEDCVTAKGFGLYFSPDGSRLLVVRQVFGDEGWERRFQVFAIPSGELLKNALFPEDSVISIKAAAFSPDNSVLAFGMDDRLSLWDVETGDWRGDAMTGAQFQLPDVVQFSPDGKFVAAGENEGGLFLCSRDGELLESIAKAHEDVIRAVRFSNDGTRLATVGDDRTLRLWSIPGLKPLKIYRGHGANVFTVAFSRDDNFLASSDDDVGKSASKIWDLRSDLDFAPTELENFGAATFSPAGDVIAGTTDTQIIVWEGRTGRRKQALDAHEKAAKAVALNKSGTLVASIGQEGDAEVLRIWDVTSGELVQQSKTGLVDSRRIDFVLDDSQLLIGEGRRIHRFDREPATFGPFLPEAITQQWAENSTPNYRISPDGTRAAVCFAKDARIWGAAVIDLADSTVAASTDINEVSDVRAFFIPESDALILARTDLNEGDKNIDHGSVSVWDTAGNTVSDAAFAYDDGTEVHRDGVATVALSPDGSLLATGDFQGHAALWSFNGTAATSATPLRGHTAEIRDMAFSPDGNRLVTGSNDRTFKIWDVKNGDLITTLQESAVQSEGQVTRPTQVAFSPDGLQLATITEPPAPPMILHAFSTDMADYPEVELSEEEAALPEEEQYQVRLEKRMEAYKREYWRR